MKKVQLILVVALAASVATANTETNTATTAATTDSSVKQDTTAAPVKAAKRSAKKVIIKKKTVKKSADSARLSDEVVIERTAKVAPEASEAAVETPVVTTQAAPLAVEVSRTTVAPRFIDNVILSDALYMYGPGVDSFGLKTPDGYTADGGGNITFENILTLGYRALNDVQISANLNTLHTPMGAGEEKTYAFKDPYLRLRKSNIINSGGMKLSADLRFYAPVSEGSIKRDQRFSLRSTQYTSYTTGRWTATLSTFVRHWAFPGATGNNWALLAAPDVAYQITPTLSAGIYYELYTVHGKATQGFSSQFADGADSGLETSLSWDVTPSITFTPYLRFKTGGKISRETTSANFLLTAAVL